MIRISLILQGKEKRLTIDIKGEKHFRLRTKIKYCTQETKRKYMSELYRLYDEKETHDAKTLAGCVKELNEKIERSIGENFVTIL